MIQNNGAEIIADPDEENELLDVENYDTQDAQDADNFRESCLAQNMAENPENYYADLAEDQSNLPKTASQIDQAAVDKLPDNAVPLVEPLPPIHMTREMKMRLVMTKAPTAMVS